MCPVCVASAAAWVVGGTVPTSGITALAVRVLGSKKKRESGNSTKRSGFTRDFLATQRQASPLLPPALPLRHR